MTQPVAQVSRADQALAVYLEPHAERRRVLLLAGAEGELARRLQHVADALEIIDPAARLPSAGQVPELPFDDAWFDLVVVADVGLLPEPHPEAVRELRRVLTDDGTLVLCGYNHAKKRRRGSPEALLEGLLRSEFRFVQVLAQAPLAGYSLGIQDGVRDDEFSVDSSLVRGRRERVERLLAVGSDVRLQLEPRLWVQVPAQEPSEAAQEPDPNLVRALQLAEDEAREALHRESDLLRELEALRRAHEQSSHLAERAKLLERRLTEAEGDYDDAVARIRFLENELLEREELTEREKALRLQTETALSAAQAAAEEAEKRRTAAEQEREGLRAEIAELSAACDDFEKRLVEAGERSLALAQEKKHHETVARDLLEELRRREQAELTSVEHDARVKELEAERERAVQRALEAELARESALMRVDELRAQLVAEGRRGPGKQELDSTRGELAGLRWRLEEAEAALQARPSAQAPEAQEELEQARARARELEAEAERARERTDALEAELERVRIRAQDAERVVELEAELDRMDHRMRELTRELEEADRFAEAHAEDADRIDALDAELSRMRQRSDEQEDELRAALDELHRLKSSAESSAAESSVQVELAQRRVSEARAERDDARAALAEARGILAQLAAKVDANADDPSSIVQALEHRETRPDDTAELRALVAQKDARIAQLVRELEAGEERIRQLERSEPPPAQNAPGPWAPETE